jgi:hypothetical protein
MNLREAERLNMDWMDCFRIGSMWFPMTGTQAYFLNTGVTIRFSKMKILNPPARRKKDKFLSISTRQSI